MFWLGILAGVVIAIGVWTHLGKKRAPDFWTLYGQAAAVVAACGVGWLAYKAGSATGTWWSSPPGAAIVAVIVGAVAPLTAFVVSWAKIRLDAQKQAHEIEHAKVKQAHEIEHAKVKQDHEIAIQQTQQSHDIAQAQAKQRHDIADSIAKHEHAITTDYLAKALDINLPLATRFQLLRFLSTSPDDKRRLQSWATAELRRIDPAFERLSNEQKAVREKLANAKNADEVKDAERELRELNTRTEAAVGKAPTPAPSVAALRVGAVGSAPGPLSFPAENLEGMKLLALTELAGSNFAGANMRHARLDMCVLSQSNFDRADLKQASLLNADFRGCSFVDADLRGATLHKARFDGAVLTGASLDRKNVGAIYDRATKWPDGFDPVAAGCVAVEG